MKELQVSPWITEPFVLGGICLGGIDLPVGDIAQTQEKMHVRKCAPVTLPETNIAPENGWLEY